jgi:hypothetical protein
VKSKAFNFHYNKPESLRQNRNVLTVHQAGKCHLVHHLIVNVPITTRHRKQQPRCVMAGKGVVSLSTVGGLVTATIDEG